MEEVRKIPVRVLEALWVDGYFKAFFVYVQEGCSHAEAYEKVEEDLHKYNLPPRYSDYQSFKRGKKYHYDKDRDLVHFF